MTAQFLISRYNAFNGAKVSHATMKNFCVDVQRHIDSDGHGPYAKELKGILERVSKVLKQNFDVMKVELNPISIKRKAKPIPKPKPSLSPVSNGIKKELQELKETVKSIKTKLTKVSKVAADTSKNKVVESPKPTRKKATSKPQPPVERKESGKATAEISKKPKTGKSAPRPDQPTPAKPGLTKNLSGFTTADQTPEKPVGLFKLGGAIGEFIGEQQRFRSQIIIDGEKFSSKSEFVDQLADAFIDAGFNTAKIDWERGGLISKDTKAGIDRNVKPENRKKLFVSDENFPTTLEALESIAKKFDVIIVDSGSKINQVTNEWLEMLRVKYPDTIWVVIMQQNSKGGTKGGTAAGYNAPVVIKTYRPDKFDHMKNYAWVEKNRGNETDKWYIISKKQIIREDPAIIEKEETTVNQKIV